MDIVSTGLCTLLAAGRGLATVFTLGAVLTCPSADFPPRDIASRLARESALPEALSNAEAAVFDLLLVVKSLMLSPFHIHSLLAPDSLHPAQEACTG
ncbi:MAG: hypothetical protein M0Z78_05610 [Betaproteobacteria bacterium]|nr:hypothetical protein [Betaproteobacteria bacterium]